MKTKILLIIILVIASALRLWNLGVVPPSPDWDEAALGYNAYSIMQTGRDEYGKFMPFVLQSFDDYKPAIYMYTIIPFIPFFGVDIVSVRLPSAIFGILTVLATYFLIKELFKRKDIALLTTLLLAISPWHIQFSRIAFETNMGLALNVFSILFFLKGLKNPWLLTLAAFCMGLNVSVYQSERAFTPLLAITLVIIFWKKLFSLPKKYLLASCLVGILVALPLATYIATNSNALARLKGVSIFSEQTKIKLETEKRYLDDKTQDNALGVLFHNKWVGYAREITSGYLSHYDFNWLFLRGDLPRHHAPFMGLLYLWELPFLLVGIYCLVFFKFPLKTKLLIFAWFFLAPIPAAITNGVPHAVRTLNFLPTFQIFIAIGLITIFLTVNKYKKYYLKYLLYCAFSVFVLLNISYYLNQYFVQLNYFTSYDWQFGYKQAVGEVAKVQDKYTKIVVSDMAPMDQSYIFFLFYLKYPPKQYQTEENGTGGFREIHTFGKYEFRSIDWEKEAKDDKTLYVGIPSDFSPTLPGYDVKIINYFDNKPAIQVVNKR
jgi:4-amino-4-deoxy-L-arabinose transferase-like glycosyltransferase